MWNQTLGCQLPSETSLLPCAPGRVDYIYTVCKTWTPWSSQLTHVQLTQGLSRKGKCCYLSSRDPGQFLALTGHAQTTPVTCRGPQTTCMEHNFPTLTTEGEGVDEQECIPCSSEGPLPCQIRHLSMASALGTAACLLPLAVSVKGPTTLRPPALPPTFPTADLGAARLTLVLLSSVFP